MTTSFFPPVAGGDAQFYDEPALHLSPDWAGPPWHVRPAFLGTSVSMGRSDTTVVLLQGVKVYPAGIAVRLVVHVRETARTARRRLFDALEIHHGRGRLDLGLPAGGLRFGFEYADGRRVTSVDEVDVWNQLPEGTDPSGWQPPGLVLQGAGRPSAAADSWSRELWLWPLPPPGPLRIVCAWPDRGVEETSVVIDATEIAASAGSATPLWPV